MNECFGRYYIMNGEFLPSESFDESRVYAGESVYEVIRIKNGMPLFFYDHFQRLEISVSLRDRKMLLDIEQICSQLLRLVRVNRKSEVNIKIVFNYNRDSTSSLIYCIKPLYPTENQYRYGVRGILFHAKRNDPESKVIDHKLRKEIYISLLNAKAYEAVLVNDEQRITEGSRSNVFFVRNGMLVTAPDGHVLHGITRKYILDICRKRNISVSFECVHTDQLGAYEAAFITGTSPMVLPFGSLGDCTFDASLPLIRQLRELYIAEAEKSILKLRRDFGASFGG